MHVGNDTAASNNASVDNNTGSNNKYKLSSTDKTDSESKNSQDSAHDSLTLPDDGSAVGTCFNDSDTVLAIPSSNNKRTRSSKHDAATRLYRYEVKKHKKLVRILTVIAYVICVSMAAIVLSLYYVFLWNPTKYNILQYKAVQPDCDRLLQSVISDSRNIRMKADQLKMDAEALLLLASSFSDFKKLKMPPTNSTLEDGEEDYSTSSSDLEQDSRASPTEASLRSPFGNTTTEPSLKSAVQSAGITSPTEGTGIARPRASSAAQWGSFSGPNQQQDMKIGSRSSYGPRMGSLRERPPESRLARNRKEYWEKVAMLEKSKPDYDAGKLNFDLSREKSYIGSKLPDQINTLPTKNQKTNGTQNILVTKYDLGNKTHQETMTKSSNLSKRPSFLRYDRKLERNYAVDAKGQDTLQTGGKTLDYTKSQDRGSRDSISLLHTILDSNSPDVRLSDTDSSNPILFNHGSSDNSSPNVISSNLRSPKHSLGDSVKPQNDQPNPLSSASEAESSKSVVAITASDSGMRVLDDSRRWWDPKSRKRDHSASLFTSNISATDEMSSLQRIANDGQLSSISGTTSNTAATRGTAGGYTRKSTQLPTVNRSNPLGLARSGRRFGASIAKDTNSMVATDRGTNDNGDYTGIPEANKSSDDPLSTSAGGFEETKHGRDGFTDRGSRERTVGTGKKVLHIMDYADDVFQGDVDE